MEIRKTSIRNRKSNRASEVECLDIYDVEDQCFIDGDVDLGVPVATFSFGSTPNPVNHAAAIQKPTAAEVTSVKPDVVYQNKHESLRGITPPIDGEHFTLKRGYQLRPSTLRKLNDLKAKHPDVNAYLNTILDAAIVHYHDYILNKGGSFRER